MNQELKQYLRFFIDHRQKYWLEWLASAEFTVNNKVYSATKISLFIANYGRELRMGADIRRKGKVEKITELVKRIKKVQKEEGAALKKIQEEMKQQADRKKRSGRVEERQQSDIEYEELGVQKETGKETSRSICWFIFH